MYTNSKFTFCRFSTSWFFFICIPQIRKYLVKMPAVNCHNGPYFMTTALHYFPVFPLESYWIFSSLASSYTKHISPLEITVISKKSHFENSHFQQSKMKNFQIFFNNKFPNTTTFLLVFIQIWNDDMMRLLNLNI